MPSPWRTAADYLELLAGVGGAELAAWFRNRGGGSIPRRRSCSPGAGRRVRIEGVERSGGAAVLDLVATGRFDPSLVITATYTWDEAIDALLQTPLELVAVR
ncbi:hypothetical protein [Nocardia sp. NBC_00403]|uniref:hypothetical protein n=1 Tax=Nocardia sp. NBC_00403 TaxID=2975990 RepID=UPI002E24A1EF